MNNAGARPLTWISRGSALEQQKEGNKSACIWRGAPLAPGVQNQESREQC